MEQQEVSFYEYNKYLERTQISEQISHHFLRSGQISEV
jgi:hypothetical protein